MRGIERVGQHGVAVFVSAGVGHRLAGRVDHAEFDAGNRLAGFERGGVHEHLVLVDAAVHADVADEIETGFNLVAEGAGALERGKVQAGFLQFGDVLDRQIAERALVFLAVQHEAVAVHRFGDFRHRLAAAIVPAVFRVEIPGAALAVLLVGGKEVGQFVVVHAQELDIHFIDIDGNHGKPARFACRQHAALRGKTNGRLQRAGEDVLARLAAQGFAVDGGKFGLHLHVVRGIGLHERKTQGLAILVQCPASADRGALAVLYADEVVKGLRADQCPGEFQSERELPEGHLRACRDDLEACVRRWLGRLRRHRWRALGFGHRSGLLAAAAQQHQRACHQGASRSTPSPVPLQRFHGLFPLWHSAPV